MFWFGRINIKKIIVLPKKSMDSMQSLSNYQWCFSQKKKGKNSQLVWKHKRPQIAKAILRKKNGTGGISLPDFRLYSKAVVTQTVRCWHTHTEEIQTNGTRLKRWEIEPLTYGSLIFDQGGKKIQKKTASSISGIRKTGQLHVKE